MEGQTKFQTALKKTVVMFKTLTGKELTEEEGSIFINLLDMTEGYLTTGEQKGDKSAAQLAEMKEAKALIKRVEEALATEPVAAGEYVIAAMGINDMPLSFDDDETAGSPCNAVGAEPGQHKTTGIDGALDKPYVVPPITTSKRDHIQGYDWQIVVLSREKDASDSYVVHFAYQPTQEQFEEHFGKFVARTHYVHVNEWERLRDDWVGVTSHYTNTHRLGKDHDPRWEQDDMAYRIRYYDRETRALTFKYVPRKPSGNELATYHHTKGFATVQSKVA